MIKWIKIGGITTAALVGTGLFFFGNDFYSYASTSVNEARNSVREAVPVEFELARARDLVEEIIPELEENVRTIAREEVEIEQLRIDIADAEDRMHLEEKRIAKLRKMLNIRTVDFTIGENDYSRDQIKNELGRRFEFFKEAKTVMENKEATLYARERALDEAVKAVSKARHKKVLLENRIQTLASQHRLIQAQAYASHVSIDQSKIAKADKLLDEIQKRLKVAERVMAHEARFVEQIDLDEQTEQDLLSEVDAYFNEGKKEIRITEDAIDFDLASETRELDDLQQR